MYLHGNLMFEGVILHVSSHKLNFGVRVCKNKKFTKKNICIYVYHIIPAFTVQILVLSPPSTPEWSENNFLAHLYSI